MAMNPNPVPSNADETHAPNDLPPPYSAVVGNPQYGFVVTGDAYATPATAPAAYPQPKTFTAPGVYPFPQQTVTMEQSHHIGVGGIPPPPPAPGVVGLMIPSSVGTEPTTVTCFNCNKVVTTRVAYTTAWHTHLVAGSICVITMFCSLCCLGLVPYCFDTFKDAEHYCPNCNSFIGKCNKC